MASGHMRNGLPCVTVDDVVLYSIALYLFEDRTRMLN